MWQAEEAARLEGADALMRRNATALTERAAAPALVVERPLWLNMLNPLGLGGGGAAGGENPIAGNAARRAGRGARWQQQQAAAAAAGRNAAAAAQDAGEEDAAPGPIPVSCTLM
jgi:hypothetical protein